MKYNIVHDYYYVPTETLDLITPGNINLSFFLTTLLIGFLVNAFVENVGSPVSISEVVEVAANINALDLPDGEIGETEQIWQLLLYNNISLEDAENTEDLRQQIAENLNCLHLIIHHSAQQHLVIATLNPNMSLNVIASKVVNYGTNQQELNEYFNNIIQQILLRIQFEYKIKLTILCAGSGNFYSTSSPFFPYITLLQGQTWNLAVNVFNHPDIFAYIQNVGNNLNNLQEFLSSLIDKTSNIYRMVYILSRDDHAEDTWSDIKAMTQLIRYIETIHRIYSPIEALNVEFSIRMEED